MEEHEITFVCEKDGAEIWLCLQCGRQIEIVCTPFSYKVVEAGEETVPHSGSRSSLEGIRIIIPYVT